MSTAAFPRVARSCCARQLAAAKLIHVMCQSLCPPAGEDKLAGTQASLWMVAQMVNAIGLQAASDGSLRLGSLRFAGPSSVRALIDVICLVAAYPVTYFCLRNFHQGFKAVLQLIPHRSRHAVQNCGL